MLKNAKDACATEALEIATYTAIERLAGAVGDAETAKLAASIRPTRRRCSSAILREIPKLTDAVVDADVKGDPSYDVTTTGAADAVRDAAATTKTAARKTTRPRSAPRVKPARFRASHRPRVRSRAPWPRRGSSDRALRQPHGRRDHREADGPVADRSGQDRLLRAQEPEPHHGPEPYHLAARRRAVGGLRRADRG